MRILGRSPFACEPRRFPSAFHAGRPPEQHAYAEVSGRGAGGAPLAPPSARRFSLLPQPTARGAASASRLTMPSRGPRCRVLFVRIVGGPNRSRAATGSNRITISFQHFAGAFRSGTRAPTKRSIKPEFWQRFYDSGAREKARSPTADDFGEADEFSRPAQYPPRSNWTT